MNANAHVAVLDRITAERRRQVQLLRAGTIPWDCADPDASPGYKLAVLAEEGGEVARAVLEGEGLRDELIQVAAVACAWAEALEAA